MEALADGGQDVDDEEVEGREERGDREDRQDDPGVDLSPPLRAVISNGDFQEYWRFHLEREHQRLYPGVKQGQYTLGA